MVSVGAELNAIAILALNLLLRIRGRGGNSVRNFKSNQPSIMKKPAKKAPVAKASKPAPAPAAPPAKKAPAPAKKKSGAGEPPATFISAQVDIGFGNHLTIRGEGPGLSWDDGVIMDCVGANLWTIAVKKATKPVVFKVLVNDLSWNTGADYSVTPGQSITIYPTF